MFVHNTFDFYNTFDFNYLFILSFLYFYFFLFICLFIISNLHYYHPVLSVNGCSHIQIVYI